MKDLLRRWFQPLLRRLEAGDGEYHYRPMNRHLLVIIGLLFCGLAAAVLVVAAKTASPAAAVPILVFAAVGITCLVVAWVGSDRAVARIWNSRR